MNFAYLIKEETINKSKADLENFFVSNNISNKDIARLLIVVDEVVSNIVYHGSNENGALVIDAKLVDNTLTLVFKDNSHKFNPLEASDPDTKQPIKDRDVGGLGILLIKKIADSLSYEYKDDCNVLTFVKTICK